MSSPEDNSVSFSKVISSIRSVRVRELHPNTDGVCGDLFQATQDALQEPEDFPPLASAVVPGDRVALAVDPNVPNVSQIVLGAIKALEQTDASAIDVVIWDEAKPDTVDLMVDIVAAKANVVVHHPSDRDSLRYLAADAAADPIYLNRYIVDADLVLPIVVSRPLDVRSGDELNGIFPAFADSASRYRFLSNASSMVASESESPKTDWLLGVHMILSLVPSADGGIHRMTAGTPYLIRKQLESLEQQQSVFDSAPGMIVVSLDGDCQQQTWANAARAVRSARQHIEPGGTIVLWSQIDTLPSGRLLALAGEDDQPSEQLGNRASDEHVSGDGFPVWDDSISAADTFREVAAEYRLLMRSQIDRETIEAIGLGVVDGADELAKLSESFESCGVIRGGQFCGTTYDRAFMDSRNTQT